MTPSTCQISLLCALLAPLSLSGLLCHPCPTPQLDISATVNTRPGASTPAVRAGSPVVIDYLVSNHSWTRLVDVHVTEPSALGGVVSCDGGGDTVVLRHGASVDCVVRLTAAPGSHGGTVTVTARADEDEDDDGDDQDQISASAAVGYQGTASSLTATDLVSAKPDATGGQVALSYLVTNTGNAPLFDFAATDTVLPTGVTCPQPGEGLAPGSSLTCTGTAHLGPGSYLSSLKVSAGDRTSTVDPGGDSVPPPKVTATATAAFDVVALPPPPGPPPPPPTTPPPPPPSPPASTPQPPPTTPASPVPPSQPRSTAPPPPPSTPPAPTVSSPPPAPQPPPQPSPTAMTPMPSKPPKPLKPPKQEAAAMPSRPGLKTPLFLLVMMMPAAGAAAVLAARRK